MENLIFITGATGFIGAEVVNVTLNAGHRVRLSIRKAEQERVLRDRYASYVEKLEFVVIPDITKSEHFENVLGDVDHVFHIASPMPGKGTDFKRDYVDPAVKGTESILLAAMKHKNIKSVIVMSSVLALVPIVKYFGTDGLLLLDNTGEEIPVNLNMKFPEGFAGHGLKYSASKILAHQATRNFLKERLPHYKLLSFHPVFVIGPSRIQQTANDIDGMNAAIWTSLHSEKPSIPSALVDVRDVAEAHLKVLENPIESGTEFVLSAPPLKWEEVVEVVKANYPAIDVKLKPPYAEPWKVDTSTAEKLLGMRWRSREEMIGGLLDQQIAFGK
ncbi:hypothetical protein F5884DRAFT_659299 [Xylogone sp. PMI_703]|nr:hypothetical protein F5884DRAFT_659299 [Xylogone sp. PMI_703]